MLQAMRAALGDNDMMAYLAMMAVRLIELHRVLRPTGSLYLQCDPTASHYLKSLWTLPLVLPTSQMKSSGGEQPPKDLLACQCTPCCQRDRAGPSGYAFRGVDFVGAFGTRRVCWSVGVQGAAGKDPASAHMPTSRHWLRKGDIDESPELMLETRQYSAKQPSPVRYANMAHCPAGLYQRWRRSVATSPVLAAAA